MRAILFVSLAVTTAMVSSAALAADSDILKRRFPAGQQFLRPVVKGGTAGRGQFNTFVRPPVQTIAPALTVSPKPVTQLPTQVKFAIPTGPTGKPDVKPFSLIQPAPVAKPPVIDIKQTLPIQPTRQIVPEASDPTTAKFVAPPVAAPVAPPPAAAPIAPAPTPIAATPPPVAPAPTLAGKDVPDVTGTLQPEVSANAAPAAPQAVGKPADAQALVQGDAAPAAPVAPVAPQADAQAAAPAAPVAPVTPVVPVKPKKKARVYVQDYSDEYSDDGYGYGYQPRVRYSYDNGYGGGYNGGGYYGNDGCE